MEFLIEVLLEFFGELVGIIVFEGGWRLLAAIGRGVRALARLVVSPIPRAIARYRRSRRRSRVQAASNVHALTTAARAASSSNTPIMPG